MENKAQFAIRLATSADIPALAHLMELSVRGLQTNDYTREQIQGALGHVLALDTLLIEDRTYYVVAPVGQPGTLAACGGWSFGATSSGAITAPITPTAAEPYSLLI